MARVIVAPPESNAQQITSARAEDSTPLLVLQLDRIARAGMWALLAWTVSLFLGTLTHQPNTRTDFAGFASYVTTTEFLFSHIVLSIVGAGIGALGLLALFTFLALRARSRLAAVGLAMTVIANVMMTAVFGMAAFAQPAIGRLYLAGNTADAVAINNDMYGGPLMATAATGLVFLVIGMIALGIAITRSRVLPRWAGIGMAVGIVVFAPIGFILADFVQSIGAVLLIASTLWLAYAALRAPALP
jgi:hypothetical protein